MEPDCLYTRRRPFECLLRLRVALELEAVPELSDLFPSVTILEVICRRQQLVLPALRSLVQLRKLKLAGGDGDAHVADELVSVLGALTFLSHLHIGVKMPFSRGLLPQLGLACRRLQVLRFKGMLSVAVIEHHDSHKILFPELQSLGVEVLEDPLDISTE
jgi:hypothetical protein